MRISIEIEGRASDEIEALCRKRSIPLVINMDCLPAKGEAFIIDGIGDKYTWFTVIDRRFYINKLLKSVTITLELHPMEHSF